MILGFDTETTTKGKGHVHDPANYLVSSSFARLDPSTRGFRWCRDPDFLDWISSNLRDCTELVGHNLKFDIQWLMRYGIKIPRHIKIYDTSIAEFILSGQTRQMVSLNEVLETYGYRPKLDAVAGYWEAGIDTPDIPVEILEEYNNDDAAKTLPVRESQIALLSGKQLSLVYQQGADLLVLARTELHGVKYDISRATEEYRSHQERLQAVVLDLSRFIPAGIPDGCSFNLDSGDQVSALLYGGVITYDYSVPENRVYGKTAKNPGEAYIYNRWYQRDVEFPRRFIPLPRTEVKKTKDDPLCKTRLYSVDDGTLRQLRGRTKEAKELLALIGRKAKLSKVLETFTGIDERREKYSWGEYLHGQFNQTIAKTGRLSSSNPNMQNSDEVIDSCLISRYD